MLGNILNWHSLTRLGTSFAAAIVLTQVILFFPASNVQATSVTTPKNFADWCKNKKNLSPDARHTVDVLLEQAGTKNCSKASQRLDKRSSLNLTEFPGGDTLGTKWNLEPNKHDTKYGAGDPNIVDVSPIASLKNLKVLLLAGNQIQDVSPLSSLTNLEELDLYFNQISDIKPLSFLINLKKLALNSNKGFDLSPLSNLKNLTFLQLTGLRIKDVSPLPSLTKLETLKLGWNEITDVSQLSTLTNLKLLDLRANPLATHTCPVKPETVCEFQ